MKIATWNINSVRLRIASVIRRTSVPVDAATVPSSFCIVAASVTLLLFMPLMFLLFVDVSLL